jgi:hypothetical protein
MRARQALENIVGRLEDLLNGGIMVTDALARIRVSEIIGIMT